jgi:hypothetical protein
MRKIASDSSVKRNPTDLKLIREVTLQQYSNWLMEKFEGLIQSQEIIEKIQDLDKQRIYLSPIFDEMRDGDSLWLSQSQQIGPLYGHEGIALVRDQHPLIYIRIIVY